MITVVDDDPSVRRALMRLLRSLGFEVETFGSAQEYFECDHREKTECMILDIHLGGISGFELQQRIIAKGMDPPVIFITAHDDEQIQEHALKGGAISYLRKPFHDQALIDAIEKAIHSDKP